MTVGQMFNFAKTAARHDNMTSANANRFVKLRRTCLLWNLIILEEVPRFAYPQEAGSVVHSNSTPQLAYSPTRGF